MWQPLCDTRWRLGHLQVLAAFGSLDPTVVVYDVRELAPSTGTEIVHSTIHLDPDCPDVQPGRELAHPLAKWPHPEDFNAYWVCHQCRSPYNANLSTMLTSLGPHYEGALDDLTYTHQVLRTLGAHPARAVPAGSADYRFNTDEGTADDLVGHASRYLHLIAAHHRLTLTLTRLTAGMMTSSEDPVGMPHPCWSLATRNALARIDHALDAARHYGLDQLALQVETARAHEEWRGSNTTHAGGPIRSALSPEQDESLLGFLNWAQQVPYLPVPGGAYADLLAQNPHPGQDEVAHLVRAAHCGWSWLEVGIKEVCEHHPQTLLAVGFARQVHHAPDFLLACVPTHLLSCFDTDEVRVSPSPHRWLGHDDGYSLEAVLTARRIGAVGALLPRTIAALTAAES